MSTGIEWTDETWNPTTGCTKVSPGCDHCYAEVMYERFNGKGSFATVKMHSQRLAIPFHWRRPRKVFVNSMSDLFHKDVTDFFIAEVFAVMALTPRHTYQILTKRHARMRSLLSSRGFFDLVNAALAARHEKPLTGISQVVLPNVWLGVSVENQQWADIRIPALVETPAAIRFLSCEPLLGPVDLWEWLDPMNNGFENGLYWQTRIDLDWVIVGGESGRGARPMHPDWARTLRDQCERSGIPYLFKQYGAHRLGVDLPADQRERGVEVLHDGDYYVRMSKHAAGRELDGRTWDQYPAVAS